VVELGSSAALAVSWFLSGAPRPHRHGPSCAGVPLLAWGVGGDAPSVSFPPGLRQGAGTRLWAAEGSSERVPRSALRGDEVRPCPCPCGVCHGVVSATCRLDRLPWVRTSTSAACPRAGWRYRLNAVHGGDVSTLVDPPVRRFQALVASCRLSRRWKTSYPVSARRRSIMFSMSRAGEAFRSNSRSACNTTWCRAARSRAVASSFRAARRA